MSQRRAPKVRPLPAYQAEGLRRAIAARRFSAPMKAALLALLEGATFRQAAASAGLRWHRDVAKSAAKVPGLREAHVQALLAKRQHEPLARLWRHRLARVPAPPRRESVA